MFQTGKYARNEDCMVHCKHLTVEKAMANETHEQNCTHTPKENCRSIFYLDGSHEKVRVTAEEMVCPEGTNFIQIFGVIAAIVLIGLGTLLLWKLLTTIHDRREYAKFEKERKVTTWGVVIILFEIMVKPC